MNKSSLPTWLSGLCVLLLAAVLALQFKETARLKVLERQQADFGSVLAGLPARLSDQAETLRKSSASMAELVGRQSVALEQMQKADQAHRESNFREMRRQLDDLVASGALFPNKSGPASEAVTLAEAAKQAGNLSLAKIYYLSAVNHAPSEFPVLDGYAQLVLRDPSVTSDELGRLKSVLQISLYQVPPGSITNALALMEQTARREEQLLAAQNPPPEPVNWSDRFQKLLATTPLSDAWNDLKKVSKRWEELNEITESLREEQPSSDLFRKAESELDLTQRVLAASRLASVMETIMAQMTSLKEQPEKAVSLLQTAEATLGQVWGIDPAGWPADLRAKTDSFPKLIQRQVEAVASLKSQPFIEAIEKERQSALQFEKESQLGDSSAGPVNQRIIKNNEVRLDGAIAASRKLSSASGREQADMAIKEIQKTITEAKRRQFDRYQQWALERCQIAFTSWKMEKQVTEPDAKRFFEEAELAAVDQSVLSPDVSRAFNDVLGKLTAEMDGKAVFETQKACAEATKMKLEDF